MFKKIYIEITNICNLNCSFCPHNKRDKKYMSTEEFKIILIKIKSHTKYIYLHVLGEPLMHPNINEFLAIASEYFYINITTNGYLVNKIKNRNIRQLNISLQSFDPANGLSLEEYMNNIFKTINYLKENTYISLRLWVNNKYTLDILGILERKYHKKLKKYDSYKNITLDDNVFLSFNSEFNWPNIHNEIIKCEGYCYALKDHLAILVDGTVVPCCLDSEGIINLGNIFTTSLESIIKSKRYQEMKNGFKQNKKCERLCQTCTFIK